MTPDERARKIAREFNFSSNGYCSVAIAQAITEAEDAAFDRGKTVGYGQAVLDERAACAKVAENAYHQWGKASIAAAIQARGEA